MFGSAPFAEPAASAFEFDGGLVLLDERRGRLFVYEGDAASLWKATAAGLTTSEIRAEIARAGSPATARAVDALLAQWARDGLLRPSRAAPPPAPSAVTPRRAARERLRWRSRVGALLISFAADAPELAWQLQQILGISTEPGPADAEFAIETLEGGGIRIRRGETEVIRATDEGLLRGAVYQACLDLLHGAPRWHALIHGAAVGRGGRAVVLPAPSGRGKTTLTAWLASRGFDYLADDLAAVLGDGRVAPWPLPISVKAGSVPVLSPVYPHLAAAPELESRGRAIRLIAPPEGAWSQPPLPLALIVFPRFDPKGDGIPRPLRPLHALARLANDRVWIGSPLTRDRVAEFLAWLETVPAFAIDYAGLDLAERAMTDLLDRI